MAVCVGRGPLSMPSEEECLAMATQRTNPSADGVCVFVSVCVRVCAPLARGSFPSSLVSSQINLLRNEHKVSG